jgi:hypothetical protein
MNGDSPENDLDDDMISFGLELSDREIYSIGSIVALWGSLESAIFCQTLETYGVMPNNELPKAMNNMQSSQVLPLWKERVVDAATGKRREVLQEQYEKIVRFSPLRHAMVHGMWDWSGGDPEKIEVWRVRKDEILEITITAGDLARFSTELRKLNFKIRYPSGLEEYTQQMSQNGLYISRRLVALITDSPSVEDWNPFGQLPSEPTTE